jgi:hypothetical protein
MHPVWGQAWSLEFEPSTKTGIFLILSSVIAKCVSIGSFEAHPAQGALFAIWRSGRVDRNACWDLQVEIFPSHRNMKQKRNALAR